MACVCAVRVRVRRFSNLIFKSCWSRDFIKNITITFKEDVGVEGRGAPGLVRRPRDD